MLGKKITAQTSIDVNVDDLLKKLQNKEIEFDVINKLLADGKLSANDFVKLSMATTKADDYWVQDGLLATKFALFQYARTQ